MAQAHEAYHPLRTIVELVVCCAVTAACFAYAAYTVVEVLH